VNREWLATQNSTLLKLWGNWQREEEGTPLTQNALNPDSPTVLRDNAVADSQSKTRASLRAGVRSIDLLEPSKNGF
jgi:hypothetical protein